MALVSLSEARAFDGIESSASDAHIQMAIAAAENRVRTHCGRRFDVVPGLTARTFRPDPCPATFHLPVGAEIATTTGLIIATDDNDDGVFETTWVPAEFVLSPLDGIGEDGLPGWPYTRIAPLDRWWPTSDSGRPTLRITAQWGWLAVPDSVKLACLYLARELLPNITLGYGGFTGATGLLPTPAADLLIPFRRGMSIVGIG